LTTADFDHDPAGRYLAAMVKAAGLEIKLHQLTGPVGIPVVACAPTSGQPVYGAGAQLVDAIREALTAALYSYQRHLDPALRAAAPAPPAIWTDPTSSAQLDPDQLVHALTNLGYTPSIFALDHDRAFHERSPTFSGSSSAAARIARRGKPRIR
jgi:ribosomal protein S12 methylthiotransferase accessory factor YcaO